MAVEIERNVMFLILTLIILVAALNIISGLYMLVKNKSADIAILRTMGATRGAIMRIFIISGMSIGVVGTFVGFAHRVLFCREHRIDPAVPVENHRRDAVRSHDLFPEPYAGAEWKPSEVVSVVVMALSLSFLATLYPSWRAARLDPVEALRYE